jgi:PadR family transcriptional regulator PadR
VSDEVDREFRLAFWKIHILHHAATRPVYGLWMLEELAEHGHRLSPGTLYPILARMEKHGWLRSDGDGSTKARRNYRITPRGRKILEALRRDLIELHAEVVEDPETTSTHRRASRGAVAQVKRKP